MKFKQSVLASALALSLSIVLVGCNDSDDQATIPEGTALSLRLLETTDIHMYLMNYNYFTGQVNERIGLVKAATAIKQARGEVDNVLLVDNGDLIQGSPMGDYMARNGITDTHPAFKAMNEMGYAVGNIGNHEFNYGLDFLKQSLSGANFPYISANVFKDDGDNDASNDVPYFSPYIIQDVKVKDTAGKEYNLKVGFIGFVPPQIMQWDKNNLTGKVIAKDMVEMAEHYVPKMKAEGADIVVAIPHSGLYVGAKTDLLENATYHLAGVKGIDALLFGHSHQNFPGGSRYDGLEDKGVDNVKGSIQGVPAVMPGYWGNHIGLIDLNLVYKGSTWKVEDFHAELRSVETLSADVDVVDAIATEHKATDDWVSEPFAKISAPVNSFFALIQDDPSIQIVADAQIWYGKKLVAGTELEGLPVLSAAAPFRNGYQGPDDYTNVAAGDIAYRNVADLYIYPNTVKILKLTGAEVKEWLEMSAGQFNRIDPASTATVLQPLVNSSFPTYNFDVIDGVNYKIDVTQPARYTTRGELISAANERIVNLSYNGEPIDSEQVFLVVSNNYRATGGGHFPGISSEKIAVDSPDENRQVLANYITEQSGKNPDTGFDPSADGNWQFAAPATSVTVTFSSSPSDEAKAIAAGLAQVTLTGERDEKDRAVYQLTLGQ